MREKQFVKTLGILASQHLSKAGAWILEVKPQLVYNSSIGVTLAFLTSLPVQDGGPHDFRSKMAAPMTPRWRPPRNQDGGPCDAFGYTLEGESTP